MKKLIYLFLAFICVLSFCACEKGGHSNSNSTEDNGVISSDEESHIETPDVIKLKREMLPGFEIASDIPANSQNPWKSDLKLSTMPVMKKGGKQLTTLDATQMANEIALSLGLAIGGASVNEAADGGFMVGLSCSEGLQTVSISVNEFGEVSIIYLRDGKAVPDEYKDSKFDWLVDTYVPLFFDGETVRYEDGDFGAIYKKGKGDKENIINYYFNNINFIENMNLDDIKMQMTYTGTLQTVTAKCSDYYDAVEYPIISLDSAKELLAKGKCYRAVSENDFTYTDMKSIVSVSLVYGMKSTNNTYIPSYCFWIEAERDGQPCYVPFCVPAISDEYLDTSGIDFLMEKNLTVNKEETEL